MADTDSAEVCAMNCHLEATCKAFAWDATKRECSLLKAITGCLWTGTTTMLDYYTYHREGGVKPKADGCAFSEDMGTDGWKTNNAGYRGCQHRTRSGRSCVAWNTLDTTTVAALASDQKSADDTDGTHSFCRNPDAGGGLGRRKTIWCYYEKADVTKWEYCDPLDIPRVSGWEPEQCAAIKERGLNQYMTLNAIMTAAS